jgi:hypothetical protein
MTVVFVAPVPTSNPPEERTGPLNRVLDIVNQLLAQYFLKKGKPAGFMRSPDFLLKKNKKGPGLKALFY